MRLVFQRILSGRNLVWIVLLFFGLVYCDISLLNHYLFRSTAWDLGIFNNAIYDYAHGRFNDSMVRIPMSPHPKNLLADHLELYLILFSPLYYVFGSWTLLILQIAAVLIGGYGTYRYILFKTSDEKLSLLSMAHFFCIWGIYTALAFDYHNNVVATMGVPWMLLFFDKKKYLAAFLVLLLVIVGKENMPLFTGFIFLAVALWSISDRRKAWMAAGFSLFSFASFIIIIKYIIPFFAPPGEGYAYHSYTALGNDFGEVFRTVLTRPLYAFKLLFVSHLPGGGQQKLYTHLAFLFSGGLLLILHPKYLLMLIPVFGQKLFYDEPTRWGVHCHYSIEFVPILAIGAFLTMHKLLRNRKWLYYGGMAVILLSLVTTIIVLDSNRAMHQRGTSRFYAARHYTREFNVPEAHRALKLIPPDASVSAQSVLVPHLAFRDTIYQWPVKKDSVDYVVLLDATGVFEMPPGTMKSERSHYRRRKDMEIVYDANRMLIVRRRHQ